MIAGQTLSYVTYWTVVRVQGCWCHGCYQDQKGDKILMDGAPIKKSDLQKRKNDEEIEEGWVQCDACELWVHQICGMFNKGRNNNDVHYLCPECLLDGLDSGERQRLEVRQGLSRGPGVEVLGRGKGMWQPA